MVDVSVVVGPWVVVGDTCVVVGGWVVSRHMEGS